MYEVATGQPLPKLEFEAVSHEKIHHRALSVCLAGDQCGGHTRARLYSSRRRATNPPPFRVHHPTQARGLAGVKQATIELPAAAPTADGAAGPAAAPQQLRIAVVNGIANARKLLNAYRAGTAPPLEFIEVRGLACVLVAVAGFAACFQNSGGGISAHVAFFLCVCPAFPNMASFKFKPDRTR